MLAGQTWIYMVFVWTCMGSYGFGKDFNRSGACVPGGLWRRAVAPIHYHAQSLGPGCWMAGWWPVGGRMDGGWWAVGWRWWASL